MANLGDSKFLCHHKVQYYSYLKRVEWLCKVSDSLWSVILQCPVHWMYIRIQLTALVVDVQDNSQLVTRYIGIDAVVTLLEAQQTTAATAIKECPACSWNKSNAYEDKSLIAAPKGHAASIGAPLYMTCKQQQTIAVQVLWCFCVTQYAACGCSLGQHASLSI